MPRKFVQKAMSYIGDSGGIDTYKTADGFTQYADNIQAIGT